MSSPLQQTAQWFADRCGCLTASRAAAVLQRRKDGKPTAAYEALIDTLICERVTNQPEGIGNPPSIQWGRDHEDEARDAYEDATGELVDLVGFIPHPTIEFFGASPKCYAASLLFGARFFSDWNVELLFGQLNHVRVSGTAHLLEIKGLFEPLDLLESLGQGELFGVNLGLL